jgi:CubicO group peptidase (beta-lactamase class C family)
MSSPAQISNSGRGREAGRFAAAYRVLEDAVVNQAFPGCAFGVMAGGEVALIDGLGRFTYDPASPTVTAETVYDVASVTKVVATTAAAMLLVQRGEIDLETPLGELLPGFIAGRASADPARRVTLKNLLAHNSGLPGYAELFREATTPAALFQACLELPLEAEPGVRAEYSDPGFILLGKALEVRMHEPLIRGSGARSLARWGWLPPDSALPRRIGSRFRQPRRTRGFAIA